ncbi:hypothetical protein JCM33374_g1891 [Metschnikowia sp. JCM 33374]|nr:hypothetical protein JCM33374_g1891 [Metschnikowia sp. JCM 33374]
MSRSPIVEDYASSLADLTFNSRPIIDNLTIIAKENTDNARGILAAITSRIYKCIPEQKLFALYLLDSIVKTVGPPYNVLAGEEIFKIFSHVYLLVGEATRAKLVKMYELWRVTKTKGSASPLFPPDQLTRIGDFLRSAGYRKPDAVAAPKAATAASLVADIDALLPVLQGKIAASPSDAALVGKKSALVELRSLLLSQKLQPNELLGISQKLAPMKKQELASVSVPLQAASAAPELPAVSAEPAAKPISRADALFSGLIASGLVKVDQSLKPGSKPEYGLVLPKHKYSPGKNGLPSTNALEQLLLDANLAAKSQYEQIKFKELVKVSQKLTENGTAPVDIQKFVSTNVLDAATVQVLYETKASKCSQCGKRFTADEAGAAKKRTHLDWHFRINQKQANFKSNVQSRNWYLDDYAWVQFRDDDLLEYESAPKQDKREVEAPVREVKESYVVIPSTESNTSNMCTICREQVKPTYKDSIGEWVWDACMLVPGSYVGNKIVHVSCFEEANRKRSAEDDGDRTIKRERVY